jgi:hypothetical protein
MIRAEAREAAQEPLDWHSTPRGEACAYRQGPFLVVVTREVDTDPSEGGREYKWWVSAYPITERVGDLRSRGYARQPAREEAQRQLQEEYWQACNRPEQYILSAQVYHSAEDPEGLFRFANSTPRPNGALLGSDCCGGFYDPSDQDAREVAGEALAMARAEVRKLQGVQV